jgi:hypothetical protein
MAASFLTDFLRRLVSDAGAQGRRDGSDIELLERFVTHHNEDASAALVQRHGPMVLSICR